MVIGMIFIFILPKVIYTWCNKGYSGCDGYKGYMRI